MARDKKLYPLNDCLLLEADPFENYDQYKGYKNIVLPDQYAHGPEDRNFTGIVMEAGPKVTIVKKGQRVAWGKFAGSKFQFLQKTYWILREYDLLGVFDES